MMKEFKLSRVAYLTGLFMLTVPAGELLHASDLEIYQGNSGGNTTVLMMLDTSGSMGWGSGYGGSSMSLASDYNVCLVDDRGNGGSKAILYENSDTSPVYKRYYCSVSQSTYNNLNATYKARVSVDCTPNGTGYKCYDRLTRLKDAMFSLINNSSLSGIKLGAGYYSFNGSGQKGIISIPSKSLGDTTHVANLKKFVAGLAANGGTPTAAAYAEAGAYMMGTTTSGLVTESLPLYRDIYADSPLQAYPRECKAWVKDSNGNFTVFISENGYAYNRCDAFPSGLISELSRSNWGFTTTKSKDELNNLVITRYTGFVDTAVYAENTGITTQVTSGTDSIYSGFSNVGKYRDKSYDATSIVTYSPLSDIKGTTYSSPITDTSSCSGNGIYFLTDGFPNGTEPNYVKDLMTLTLKKNVTDTSPTISLTGTKCASGLSSIGAETSGSAAWECIGEYSRALTNTTNPKAATIKTAVVGFGSSFAGLSQNTDGSYNCNSTSNVDIKNACLWGGNDYGKGGFYLASSSQKIVDSMTQFVNRLKVDFKPTNLGTISIPRDPLDTTKAMGNGYFPMIQPLTDTTRRSWLGNLKKYIVANGTLTADTAGNTKLYNSDGTLNSSAKDTWSIQTSGDHSFITSGGALNKIIVPSNQNITGDPSNSTAERRVFIIDNNQLKRVTKANLATNFTATTDLLALTDITTTTLNQRYALLNYLGYKTAYPPTATTITTTDLQGYGIPSSPYRFLAGVLHSSPVVLTKQATVTATATASGITESAARSKTEYTVYGSMDGGLHIVDAASGIEQSVFVPREILDNQPDTLAKTDASGTAPSNRTMALAYGVDAPWVADNTFNSTSRQLSDTTTTTYNATTMRVYGGLRMGGTGIYGLNILDPQNPKLLFRKTPDDSGFSRMGETWSKPVIAFVRYNKQRTKVLIFGGGYDECYENTSPACSSPKGNAVYIVKADDGTLLWSGSNSGATTNNSDMTNSIVAAPAIGDYNADGLVDAIWVADLGGQVFRIDIDNTHVNSMTSGSTTTTNSSFAVRRIATIAKLGSSVRFYERPTVGVFQEGQQRFIMVTVGSGNRSIPLSTETNYVYGLVDKDATADNLHTTSFTPSAAITVTDLDTSGTLNGVSTTLPTGSAAIKSYIGGGTTDIKKGWAMNLAASVKVFEEPQLIYNNLYVSLYDPNAGNSGTASSCSGGVKGKSTIYRMCMPYGDCAAYHTTSKEGIFGVPIGPVNSSDPTKVRQVQIITTDGNNKEYCKGAGCNAATSNTDPSSKGYQYSQARSIRLLHWYEK